MQIHVKPINPITRILNIVLMLASVGLPLFLLFTSWIPDRWPVLAFDTIAVAVAGFVLLCWAVRPFEMDIHWSLAIPLAAGIWGLFQIRAGTTVNPNATLLVAYDWLGLAAFYMVAQQFFALDRRLSRYFPSAALTFSTIYAIYAVVQWFTSQGRFFWLYPNSAGLTQVMGSILNKNHYSAYIELFLPAVFWYFVESPSRNPHAAVATCVLFASIVASSSRAGFAVAVFELVMVFLLRRYWNSRKRAGRKSTRRSSSEEQHAHGQGTSGWLIGAVVGGLLLFGLAIGVGPLEKRIFGQKLGESLADYRQSRLEYVEASIQMIKARPVLGFGLGTWAEVYPAYGSYDSPDTFVNSAHNELAEWTAEGGLLFLIPIVALAAVCVRIGFYEPWTLGTVGVLLHSLVDFPLHKLAIVSMLFLILAGGRDRSRRWGDL